MSSDLLYWVWLAERLGPASTKLSGLLARFDSAYDIYRATDEEIMGFDADGNEKLYRLADKDLDGACKIVEHCRKNRISIITYDSPQYPKRLKKLQDPPTVLYVRGRLPDIDRRVCIGVVGTRKMSEYGRDAAYKIAYELTAAGAVVVSGMASGIDGMAAVGALAAGGATVAVFGCGVDTAYPAKHKRLMEKIIERGCVISEYPPEDKPRKYYFPMRNRIISGLCNGVLVVEADEISGALITARDAIMQGRDIFAVPGNINEPGAKGTNKLIFEGAQTVRSAEDVLENYMEIYASSLSEKRLARAKGSSDYDAERAKYFGIGYKAERAEKKEALTPAAPQKSGQKQIKKQKETKKEATKVSDERTGSEAKGKRETVEALDPKTRAVYECVKEGCDTRVEEIVANNELNPAQTMAALTILEIKGLVAPKPGGWYVRK